MHLSQMLWPFEFAESFRENFERLDILCTSIRHPNEMLWPFQFLESLYCSFSSLSIYHGPHTYTRVKSYGHLNFSRASVFNFDRLDILWTSIGHPSEILWPFEFLKSLRCSFLSVSICPGPHTYTRVKSYGRLNLLRAFVFNFDRLDILCAWINILVKSYDHLNFSRASVVQSDRLDILSAWIWHPNKKLWALEFARCFCFQFRASRYTTGHNRTPELKVIVVWIFSELLFSISST